MQSIDSKSNVLFFGGFKTTSYQTFYFEFKQTYLYIHPIYNKNEFIENKSTK